MNEVKFNSLRELYERLLPALRSKRKELVKKGITFIKEEDIWETLKNNRWTNCKTLSLNEMVDDILNSPEDIFIAYVHDKYKKEERTPDVEGESLL